MWGLDVPLPTEQWEVKWPVIRPQEKTSACSEENYKDVGTQNARHKLRRHSYCWNLDHNRACSGAEAQRDPRKLKSDLVI